MESFHWDKNFETGLPDVDRQHQYLVSKINQFGNVLAENVVVFGDIEEILQDMAEYAQYHFKEEETLMTQIGVDQRHINLHIETHQSFWVEVNSLHSKISQDNVSTATYLFDYLTHWLAYHILGRDQNMARQIEAIQSGISPSEAYELEEKEANKATEPLLVALNELFQLISLRNNELMQLNQSLEEKVAKRTKELSEANRRLEAMSSTDPLTGLPNRRYAMRRLDSLWKEVNKFDLPLGCIMVDADNFKEVNDTYGHDAGDIVLIELAKTLKHALRNDDIVCRLGGDEFLIICPNTDEEGIMHIAELIRKSVSKLRVSTGGEPWHGSISVGAAARTPEIENYRELIIVADKALYIAKQDGKNCVRTINYAPCN